MKSKEVKQQRLLYIINSSTRKFFKIKGSDVTRGRVRAASSASEAEGLQAEHATSRRRRGRPREKGGRARSRELVKVKMGCLLAWERTIRKRSKEVAMSWGSNRIEVMEV